MNKNYVPKLRRLFTGKKVALLGLGLENASLLELLKKEKIVADITICDRRELAALPAVNAGQLIKLSWQTGVGYSSDLARFDLLFRSPGWPLNEKGLAKARTSGCRISSPLNLFLELCPTRRIIGVTGTKGKGTTATLIYRILKATKKRVWLGGNIGIAPLSFLPRLRTDDHVVLELSSFQLEDLDHSPAIAIITNLFREHLAPADPNNPNFHRNLHSYWQAKLRIATRPGNRLLIANRKLAKMLAGEKFPGSISFFGSSDQPSRLHGEYNKENIAAALTAAKALKIPSATAVRAIANFRNLEHRLEKVAEKDGVDYFDNSFATTPESSSLDLKSFDRPVILIAGGADKGADFRLFAKAIDEKTKHLILLPGNGTKRLMQALGQRYPRAQRTEARDMESAVRAAAKKAARGDVVLLSTGCASFGLFRNYKDRGEQFKKYVRALR